jgi:hypothetical protein
VRSLRFRAPPGAPPLRLVKAGLSDGDGSRAVGVSTAAAYVSDEVRLAEVAGTPLVSLFEVRRGIGPGWVVESLRRLPDAARVLEALRAPTRFGVDTRREALAAEADVRGVVLPSGSRSQSADVAQSAGGRIVVRAAGPGLLVIGEGFDAGRRAGRRRPSAARQRRPSGGGAFWHPWVVLTHGAWALGAGVVMKARRRQSHARGAAVRRARVDPRFANDRALRLAGARVDPREARVLATSISGGRQKCPRTRPLPASASSSRPTTTPERSRASRSWRT